MPQLVSYAQNGEDVVLNRLFRGRASGCYIDVGAGHPLLDSVTKHFYELGWHGLNVEPNPQLCALLAGERPRDVNVAVAVGETAGTATLHLHHNPGLWGLATLEEREVARNPGLTGALEVEVTTLATLVRDRLAGEAVDFLKVDVEGHEASVLRGADWSEMRPRVVLVEAIRPGSTEHSHGEWEPLLLDAGYRPVLFDGLNRFYAPRGDEEAAEVLAAPANVLDEYIRLDHLSALMQTQQLQAMVGGLDRQLAEVREQNERLRRALQAPAGFPAGGGVVPGAVLGGCPTAMPAGRNAAGGSPPADWAPSL